MKDTNLKGGPELLAFLEAFPVKLQKGALRASMTAGAAVVRDLARANVPARTGKLRRAIKSGSPKIDRDGNVRIRVYVDRKRNNHGYLGTFIEYGVRPHFISAGDAGLSARQLNRRAKAGGVTEGGAGVLKIGGQLVSGAVLHPGHAARPFLRPALDHGAAEAVNAIGARLRSYLKEKSGFTAPQTIEVDE